MASHSTQVGRVVRQVVLPEITHQFGLFADSPGENLRQSVDAVDFLRQLTNRGRGPSREQPESSFQAPSSFHRLQQLIQLRQHFV